MKFKILHVSLFLILFWGCKRNDLDNSLKDESIEEAFNLQKISRADKEISYTPNWTKKQEYNGEVYVPLKADKTIIPIVNGIKQVSINNDIWLLGTQKDQQWSFRVLKIFPEDPLDKFRSGTIIFEDFQTGTLSYSEYRSARFYKKEKSNHISGTLSEKRAMGDVQPGCKEIMTQVCAGEGEVMECTTKLMYICDDDTPTPPTPPPLPPPISGGGTGGTSSHVGANNFTMKLEDQSKYPRFTTMVKNLRDFVKNDRKVLESLIQWTGLSEQEVLSKLEFGKGPQIAIKQLSSSSEYAYFKGIENPNLVNINASWVAGLESANLLSTQQSTAFLLGVTLLHEFVHYSRFESGLDRNYEYGIQFEKDAFGVIINKDNAGNYTYRMYKK